MLRRLRYLTPLPAAVMLAATIISAAPASADDPTEAGSSCPSNQLGNTATATDGATVRCLANEQSGFSWMADTGATGTIGDLQKQGYTVHIDRVGSGELSACKVTGIRNPVTITQAMSNPPGPHTPVPVTTITLSKTISVSLDCTGG